MIGSEEISTNLDEVLRGATEPYFSRFSFLLLDFLCANVTFVRFVRSFVRSFACFGVVLLLLLLSFVVGCLLWWWLLTSNNVDGSAPRLLTLLLWC